MHRCQTILSRPACLCILFLSPSIVGDIGAAATPNNRNGDAAAGAPVVSGRAWRGDDPRAIDVAVICPPSLMPALQPWIRHRQQQGHRLVHLDSQFPAARLRATIRELAARGLRYVVVVGDADPAMSVNQFVRERSAPTFYGAAQVVTRYGSEALIASDNPYGDLDDDSVPELAVGRLSVDSPQELSQIVRKILRYEQGITPGTWKRRVDVVAGVGGFGVLTDALVEGATKKFITEELPPEYDTTMTYANWRSPYCPDPRRFRDVVLGRAESGSLFWVYIGHGNPRRLDRVHADTLVLPILETDDIPRFRSASGLPIAVILACYTGAYDQSEDCLGELMVRQPDGPVAAICGSRVTTPYAMAVFASGLLQGYFAERQAVLGDVFLAAKRELGRPAQDGSPQRKLLDSLAKTFSPTKDQLADERAEHQLLLNLLGDPLLQLPQASPLALQCRRHTVSSGILRVEGVAPFAGTGLFELVCRRDQSVHPMDHPRSPQWTDDHLADMDRVYEQANNKVWTARQVELDSGRFAVELEVPAHARGSAFVRVMIQDDREFALGSHPVFIQAEADPLSQSNAAR